jgi:hypothetical protein
MVYISRMSVLCFGSQNGTLWMLSNSLKVIHRDRNTQELRQIEFKSIILALVLLLLLLCELFVNINVNVNINIMLMFMLI